MKTTEIILQNENIDVAELRNILRMIKQDESYLFDFTRGKALKSDVNECGEVLSQILDSCKGAVLIGPQFLQPLIDGFPKENLIFIIKSQFENTDQYPSDSIEIIKKLSIDFFQHYFPNIQFADLFDIPEMDHKATVRVSLLGDTYVYSLMMKNNFFKNAIEKILLIPVEGEMSNYAELTAEVLNLICGHLRSGIVPAAVKMKVEIPENKSPKVKIKLNDPDRVWITTTGNDELLISFSKER